MKLGNQKFQEILLACAAIFTALSIIMGFGPLPKKQVVFTPQIVSQAIKPTETTVVFDLEPASTTTYVNDKFEVNIVINAEKSAIVGTDLWLSYDPEVLAVSEVKPGSFFSNPQVLGEKINSPPGTIGYGIGSFEPTPGKGVVAVISFETLAPAPETNKTQVSFLKRTVVATTESKRAWTKFSTPGGYVILE